MIHRNVDYLRSNAQNNGAQEIGASLVSEAQPFKNGLLDTLESHSFPASNTFMKPRAAPQFGSLLPQEQGFQQQNYPFEQSLVSPLTKQTKTATAHSLKVMLHCFGQVEMIKDKDMPVKFQNQDVQAGNILLKPILDYIKYLGKEISKQSISYFSEEDQCDVFVGIEGESIGDNTVISIEEMGNGA